MKQFFAALAFFFAIGISTVWAGPEGSYTVEGINPGGGAYTGTVVVERNGDTYAVRWVVGDSEYIGTGLGAANVKGTSVMGPAAPEDTAIAISYVSGDSFGLTFYVEQSDGTWKGVWTYAGSQEIGTEVWTPQ